MISNEEVLLSILKYLHIHILKKERGAPEAISAQKNKLCVCVCVCIISLDCVIETTGELAASQK